MYSENFENLIYGDDGQSPIRPLLIRTLETAKKENARLRIDVRSIALGTTNSRNEHTLFMDPNENDADGLMRLLTDRLNDSPGEGFLGQIRMNFAPAGSSGERYGSWTRTIKAPTTSSGRMSSASEEEDENEEDDNNVESFSRSPRSMSGGGGGGFSHGSGNGVLLSDDQVRLWMETMMGYVFRSQAQQFAMFERATRMMESYTLRFGFPTHEAGIIEARGGEIPSSAAPGSAGPGGFGILPMLLQAATKLAAGNSDAPAPAPAAPEGSTQLVPSARANGRAMAISGAGRMVRALRNQPPIPKRPAEGFDREPEVEEEGEEETRTNARWREEPQEDASGHDEEEGEYEEEDEGPSGGGEMPDLNGLSPEAMKKTVIDWIRADPSRKADVMNMLPDLSREIT
jgi:hypothetical protein